MKQDTLALSIFTIIGLMNPAAAIGSSFGCMFYLSIPKTDGESRLLLPIVSWGIGYATGVAVGDPHTMWSSIVAAALGSTALTVLHSVILHDNDMPKWIKYLIDSVLRLRK